MTETLAHQRRAGLPAESAMPLLFRAIAVDVSRLLDLTDTAILAQLNIPENQIITEAWWEFRARGEESFTQALGRAAHACGVHGLLAASAQMKNAGSNLVLFPDNIGPPDQFRTLRRTAR